MRNTVIVVIIFQYVSLRKLEDDKRKYKEFQTSK